jgi:hypothetical protein
VSGEFCNGSIVSIPSRGGYEQHTDKSRNHTRQQRRSLSDCKALGGAGRGNHLRRRCLTSGEGFSERITTGQCCRDVERRRRPVPRIRFEAAKDRAFDTWSDFRNQRRRRRGRLAFA